MDTQIKLTKKRELIPSVKGRKNLQIIKKQYTTCNTYYVTSTRRKIKGNFSQFKTRLSFNLITFEWNQNTSKPKHETNLLKENQNRD